MQGESEAIALGGGVIEKTNFREGKGLEEVKVD